MHAYEGGVGSFQHWTVDIESVGVGTVEHDDGDVFLGTSLHNVSQGGDVGVETHAHVLEVEQHDVDILEHFGRRFFCLPIE